ncbi:MAG: hypothetical protein U0326_06380 [Polyangiales bacterium]
MGRPRSGIGFVQHGVTYTGVRLKHGKRWVRPVAEIAPPPEGIPVNVIWAKAVSMQLQARYDRGEWVPEESARVERVALAVAPPRPPAPSTTPPMSKVAARGPTIARTATGVSGETVAKWFERWLEDRRAKGMSTVRTDGSRFRSHVEPVIGSFAMKAVTKADVERLVAKLDEDTRGGQSWRTSWNGWALTRAMFRDASRSKNTSLRVRDDNPARAWPRPIVGRRR